MPIAPLPASPAGEISHSDVRLKVNALVDQSNATETISRVIVNGDDDLPALTGGFAELAGDTEYFFQNGITWSKPLRCSAFGTSFLGTGPFTNGADYTGTGNALTINNVSVSADKWTITTSTGAQFVSAVGTGTNTLFMDSCTFNGAAKLGTFDGITTVFNNFVGLAFTDGWSYTGGPFTGSTYVNCFFVDDFVSGAIHFNLDDATFNDFEITQIVTVGSGTSLSTSVGGTANMIAGVEADIINSTLGTTTILAGFDDDFQTNQWKFKSNSPINLTEETKYECDQFLLSTNTVSVAVAGIFYEIGTPALGVWQSDIAKHFAPNADGSITYSGDRNIDVQVISTASLEKVGGGSNEVEGRIAVNWTAGGTGVEKSRAITQNSTPTSITMTSELTLSSGDNIRQIYANNDSSSNIIIYNAKIDIMGK